MYNKKLCLMTIVLITSTMVLFSGCGKNDTESVTSEAVEETVHAITAEQFNDLYETAQNIYDETPEIFLNDVDDSIFDTDIEDTDVPISEAITTSEAIQTLVTDLFPEELNEVDPEGNKEGEMDDSLYKAMVIAKQYRIIETSDSNWDEALTKGEAIQLFLNTYKALVVRDGYSTTSDQGTNEGTAIDRETNTNSSENTSETNGSDIEINGEAVGNTALTQEEIDAIKSQMSSVTQWEMDAYKAILENGSYTDSAGVTWDKVVGTPGDTSWRRMSDEEANAIISKGKPDPFENPDEAYEYQTAEAELSAGTWCSYVDSTIYFDYYACEEARDKFNEEWREAHADELGDDTMITEDDIILY